MPAIMGAKQEKAFINTTTLKHHNLPMKETTQQIHQFLSNHIRTEQLADTDDIFALGFVNSLFAMQLVLFVEQTFHITVADEDLDLDNFRSISAIADFVTRKQENN